VGIVLLVAGLATVLPLGNSTARAASAANVAPQATLTASSQNTSTGQTAAKAVDGSHDGYPGDYTREWATVGGKAGSWLNLAWSSPQTLDHVVLYDRPNSNDQITGATLTFSDGSTVSVPSLANNGSAVTVSFPARSTTSLRLRINSVSSSTLNIGLAEIEAWTAAVSDSGSTTATTTTGTTATTTSTTTTTTTSTTTTTTTTPTTTTTTTPTTTTTTTPTTTTTTTTPTTTTTTTPTTTTTTTTPTTTTGGGSGGTVVNGVVQPTPPSSYTVPSGTVMSSSSQLASALAGSTQNVILADGTYDQSTPFNIGTHHVYAQNLGGAVLTTGVTMNGTGGLVQGLSFNVSSTSKGQSGAIIYVAGANSQILDCVLHGNKVMNYGIAAYGPDGLVTQRLEIYDVTDVGIRASDNQTVSYGRSTPKIKSISDIYVNGVTYKTPGGSNGTAEAGVWVGHPVLDGVRRIKVRNVSWSGIEAVNNSWDTTFTDLDIDMSGPNESDGVGVYLEHYCYHDTFQSFYIRGAHAGFNAEWYADYLKAASHFSVIQNGTIDAAGSNENNTAGVYLDEGTESTTVTGVTFENQDWAAIGAYKNIGTNNFSGNDYSGIKPGAAQVSNGHI
jgi:hypothetical protein